MAVCANFTGLSLYRTTTRRRIQQSSAPLHEIPAHCRRRRRSTIPVASRRIVPSLGTSAFDRFRHNPTLRRTARDRCLLAGAPPLHGLRTLLLADDGGQ